MATKQGTQTRAGAAAKTRTKAGTAAAGAGAKTGARTDSRSSAEAGPRTGGRTSAIAAAGALADYARKRDFSVTSEPAPAPAPRRGTKALQFVVQKHAARRLHYDFRLELDGTLKSWAVPKGPSLDPKIKRLAVEVEDHPLSYAGFEGHIPEGEYGGGEVIVWDRGSWRADDADPAAAYRAGKLKFHLRGDKLSGGWTLVRTRLPKSGAKEQWLLIKENDAAARPESEYDVVAARPESVLSNAERPLKPAAAARRSVPSAAPPPAAKSAPRAPPAAAARPTKAPTRARRAAPAPFPERVLPQLATLVDEPPPGDWHYEVKFDGYRLLARIDGNDVRLLTRGGQDWTAKLAEVAREVAALGVGKAWLDGEIVVVDAAGRPDFQALQNAFDEKKSAAIVYFVFDLIYLDGDDLHATPLEERRARLAALLAGHETEHLRYSEEIDGAGADILKSACQLQLEGVIGKRAGSAYVERRSPHWIKLKCTQRQEFVICGFTQPQRSRSSFGALVLGVYDGRDEKGGLRYAGRVGTGFSEASLKTLHAQLVPLARAAPPFAEPPSRSDAAGVTWTEPRLVCEVEFTEWTREGVVRHAAFRGLRRDKPARAVGVEAARAAAEVAAAPAPAVARGEDKGAVKVAGVAISHPERVVDPASGTTKVALAEFYRDVEAWLLPQLARRPVAVVRAPEGIAGEQFFQRHAQKLAGVRKIDAAGEEAMLIEDLKALIGVAQMGGIELHTWNVSGPRFDRPDRMIFDLDPDPLLPWSAMVEATRLVEALLAELGLVSFLKTSGGKGMHVVVPLARRHDWDVVKTFSKGVAQHLARHLPDRFAARMGPQNRVGKIFVDYLRNQKGGTTICAYSVRARPGLPVSVPITSTELDRIGGSGEWTVATLPARLRTLKSDPWAEFGNARQSLGAAMTRRLLGG